MSSQTGADARSQTDADACARREADAGSYTVVGLGELIWDLFPSARQLGGAPSNFAYVAHLLGDEAVVASRVGADELGREARARLERQGLITAYLQCDARHATGTVRVRVDAQGEPDFAVNENSAWDYLEWTPQWEELARRADAVCFGTLAQRSEQSRAVVKQFLRHTRADALRIFDVNLRHAFFNAELLAESLKLARVVKLNGTELSLVAALLGFASGDDVALARRLIEVFALELVAITRGAEGSLLVSGRESVEHGGFRVEVADTIGAGDAFVAALAHRHLRRASLESISRTANRVGAWMTSQVGATPLVEPHVLQQLALKGADESDV